MCCLFFRNQCRCRCCPRPRPIPPTPPTPPTPPVQSGNLGARFNSLTSTDVPSGSAIPLTNTVFNNATGYITNNNGSISLTGEGLYLINYSVNATNNTAERSALTVNLNVNGAIDPSASSSTSVASGESESVSNSTLIYVPNGSTSTVFLSITSEETLSILPNVVVTKLS